jgi:hypothetical protein
MKLIKAIASLAFSVDIVLMKPKKRPTFDWHIVSGIHGLHWQSLKTTNTSEITILRVSLPDISIKDLLGLFG